MKLNYLFAIACALLLFTFNSQAQTQTDSCNIKLKNASTAYDQHDYDGSIKLLQSALNTCKLDQEDKISAYKLLALSYLAIDHLEDADAMAENIIKLNPNYTPDRFKDDPQYSALFNKFKPTPVLIAGLDGGLNFSSVDVIKTYSIVHADSLPGLATYNNKSGFQLGAFAQLKLISNLWLSVGGDFRNSAYEHILDSVASYTITYDEKLNYFEAPLSLKYYFLSKSIHPYVHAGATLSYLSNAISTTSRTGSSDLVNRTAMRNTFNIGYTVGAGVMYTKKSFCFSADFQYGLFPNQVNKAGTRYDDEVNTYKYYYIDDDFKMNFSQINISAAYVLKYKNIKTTE